MQNRKKLWTGLIGAFCLSILILDTKTSIYGAKEGIFLCLETIIPSLFPFFVFSSILNSVYIGTQIKVLRPIGKLCHIPKGGEALFLLGILGGYPVGAKSINDATYKKCLDDYSAARMLAFCNNAGPAFIFGILGGLFTKQAVIWLIWLIHILSAILVGIILPSSPDTYCRYIPQKSIRFTQSVENAIKSTALVCGWIILFRIILSFCKLWFLWYFPPGIQAVISGFLELANGCISLYVVETPGLRYILSTLFLSFGGLSVTMQTLSVASQINTKLYFPGKLLQTTISLGLAWITQFLLFDKNECFLCPVWIILVPIALCIVIYLNKNKKVVAIPV